ncbi:MAG TPA: exodeoxyribonuclease VII small subunit [Catalimonadaceae bacterium]|jgi:exodeoxyribonuclease VII small subunit|nr:exodeoxyribonuclease VII small subunit [Catalimonadaceae bacterium]HPI10629.1 exodeoxyribonuclease VII small subunit [Catalimonadaceae bacterium]
MKYQEALQELKQIGHRIENEDLDLDKIEELLLRAQELAQICRLSLRRVNDRLNEFQSSQNEA